MRNSLTAIILISLSLSSCIGGNDKEIQKLRDDLIPREKFIILKESCLKKGLKEATEELAECVHEGRDLPLESSN